jgi:hypothetical protein
MNHELKMRMLNAAIDAAPEESKVLSDAIKEIDRLHAVLMQVQDTYVAMQQQIKTVVPVLNRLSAPTTEMQYALESETPYFCRRALDKRGYEVGIRTNGDWRECISEDQTVLFTSKHEGEAEAHYEKLQFEWRYHEMMRVAGEQA